MEEQHHISRREIYEYVRVYQKAREELKAADINDPNRESLVEKVKEAEKTLHDKSLLINIGI